MRSSLSETMKFTGRFAGTLFAILILSSPTIVAAWLLRDNDRAPAILLQCPEEGRFTGPQFIGGDVPNPSEGWEVYLEGTPQKIELQPPTEQSKAWLVTCEIKIGDEPIEASTYLPGRRACHITPNGGSITSLQNGGESCLTGKPNKEGIPSCVVNCK